MSFKNKKEHFLSKPDKSYAGGIDKAVIPLCKLINSKNNYYTTSSCAGRISLMKETGRKQEKVFIFVTHKKTSFNEIRKALKTVESKEKIYFKHEPCILHVACESLNDSFALVSKARGSGWKKSGIISRNNIVEIFSTEILAAPVMKKGRMLVNEDYLKILIREANQKLVQTRKKISNLIKALN